MCGVACDKVGSEGLEGHEMCLLRYTVLVLCFHQGSVDW